LTIRSEAFVCISKQTFVFAISIHEQNDLELDLYGFFLFLW